MDPMEEEDHGIEMGQRPSRKRRHLPLSAIHSITERPAEHKKVSTFKMSSSPLQHDEGLRHRNRKTGSDLQEKAKRKEVRPHKYSKKTRKVCLGVICVIWIIFIVYRVYLSISQGNAGHLSIVHFLSSLIPL